MTSIFAILSVPKRYFMLKAAEYKHDTDEVLWFNPLGTLVHECAQLKATWGEMLLAIAEALPGSIEE